MFLYYKSGMNGYLRAGVAALALVGTPPAYAQEGQEQDEGMFQMLGRLVFGAGAAKIAIDTPQAVTALEQEDIDRLQPDAVGDLFKDMPGVQATGASTRPLGQAFNIRGIGNAEQSASEARIAVTVDGVPKFYESYRMGSFFGDVDLYKRVEVLRGPASSTLYGAGAIGGAIVFTTKDPADFLTEGSRRALKFSGGYADNGAGTRLGVIWAQRAGNAEFLAALNSSRSDDMTDGSGAIIPGSAHQAVSGLLKGIWQLDEGQSLNFSLSRTDTDLDDATVAMTGDLAFFGPAPGSMLQMFGTNDVRAIDDTLTLGWEKDGLTAQLSYTETRVDKSDFSMAAFCGPGSMAVLCNAEYSYATTALKVEKTFDLPAGAWDGSVIVGGQLSAQDRKAASIMGPLPFHPEGNSKTLGLYAQGEFVRNDRFSLFPGIRVDFNDLTPSDPSIAHGGADVRDSAISPKLAMMYQFNDQLSAFGSLAHTERMPAIDELYQYNPAADRVPKRSTSVDLRKEKANTVELGLAFQRDDVLAEDDNLQLKVTAFHNDLTDTIAPRPATEATPGLSYYDNIAAAKIWGVELEGGYDAKGWFGRMAYANIRSKDEATGMTLPDTPAESLSLTIGAKFPDQNLVLGWRGAWQGAIVTSSQMTTAPSYDTHDLFMSWSPDQGAFEGMSVNFALENIFDDTYRNNLTLDNGAGRNAKLTIGKMMTW